MKAIVQYFHVASAVYYAVQGGSNLQLCGWDPSVWPFKWKLLSEQYFQRTLA